MTRQWHVLDRFPISDNPEPEITVGNGLITGRLRAGMDQPYPRNLQTEAADEIERLKAGLKSAINDLGEGVAPEEVRARLLDVLNWEINQCRSFR